MKPVFAISALISIETRKNIIRKASINKTVLGFFDISIGKRDTMGPILEYLKTCELF